MISGEAISHSVQFEDCTGAVSAPVRASIAHLNVKGTDSVVTLASSNSTIDQATRILRSARSPGQMYGHRCASVPTRVARSADFSGGILASSPFKKVSLSAIKGARNKLRDGAAACAFFGRLLAVI